MIAYLYNQVMGELIMAKYKNRFVFSMSEDTKKQLDIIADDNDCSAAAILRRLIKQEFQRIERQKSKRNEG